MEVNPIERADFRAGELIRDHPPRWRDPNKRVVFNIADSSGAPFEGQIVFARWEKEQPARLVTAGGQFAIRLGAFRLCSSERADLIRLVHELRRSRIVRRLRFFTAGAG